MMMQMINATPQILCIWHIIRDIYFLHIPVQKIKSISTVVMHFNCYD